MNIRQAPRVPRPEVVEDPDDDFGFAKASLILGIVGICVVPCIGLLGFGTGTVGIILGIKSLRSRRKGMAIAGIVLSIISIITAIALLVVNNPGSL
jgi:hypothetical protein